ncbi:MAG: hypothetical protein WAK48_13510 [Candidatus Acidiferrum sp.]
MDEGGKIARRHSAYFTFDDGSQGGQAYLSGTPVRMIMEFDGVSTSATSATLSVGQDRVQNVPSRRSKTQRRALRNNSRRNRGPSQDRNQGGAQKPASQAKPQ